MDLIKRAKQAIPAIVKIRVIIGFVFLLLVLIGYLNFR